MNDFDLKGFINENKLGAHSKLQEEPTEEGLEKGYFKKKHGIGEQKQRVMEALGKRMAEGSYPFEKCIRDQEKRYGDKETAQRVCGAIRAAYGE